MSDQRVAEYRDEVTRVAFRQAERGYVASVRNAPDLGVSPLVVVTPRGHVDFPVMYSDGCIAYDFPERVPEYLKREVARAFAIMRAR